MSTPDLVLGDAPDGVFRCVSEAPAWAMMSVAVVAKSRDQLAQMKALVDTTKACVVPEERDRLHDYLLEHNDAVGRLQDALAPVMMYWSGRPLEQPQPSSASSPTPAPGPTSRVVSLYAGTSEAVPDEEPSETGRVVNLAG